MQIDKLAIEIMPGNVVMFERRLDYSGGRAGNRRGVVTRTLSDEAVRELRAVANLLGD